ncbi:cytochrome P450 [Catenulispora sp. GAS73]|uniref:cytochrome P450 family protein n=1 Tax=Catenulispora sp. GAS73 TaxID=3156269 RepID=UPI0035135450
MDQPVLTLDPTGANRHTEDAYLRDHGPATRVDLLGQEVWAVADPGVLKALLIDPRVSKDAAQHWPKFPDEILGKWPLALWVGVSNMFTAYGADHRRLRRLVSPAFAGRRVAALAPRIEEMTDALLDALAEIPAGQSVDLRENLAVPLPIQVISSLMGLPPAAQQAFRGLVDAVFDTTLSPEEAQDNAVKLYGVLAGLVAEKRENPGDDMTSVLIAARDDQDEEGDGSALTEQELLDTLLLVVSAGYETTVNLIDQAITLLLTHPEERAKVDEGKAPWRDVVEETLRFEAPVAHLPLRYAVEDIELAGGLVIRQGEAILASYAAIGRHPDLHGETAGAFDVTRAGQDHFAFGHGVHFCLGAPLARMEAETVLDKLFARFPDIAFAPGAELAPLGSLISNGHQALPVVLQPAVANL